MTTLAHKYHGKKNDVLIEARARHLAGSDVLAEGYGRLIVEALSKDDLKQAGSILKKLNTIRKAAENGGAEAVAQAIKKATDDVNEFTGGGLKALFKRGMAKLQQKLGAKAGENPLLKSATLLNTMETAFKDIQQLIANNIPDFDGKAGSLLDQAPDDTAKKNIARSLKKAFIPEGFFAKLMSLFGGGVPYVDNTDVFIKSILDMPAPGLAELIKAAVHGVGTDQTTQALKDMVNAAGGDKATASAQHAVAAPKAGAPVANQQQLVAVAAAATAKKQGEDPAVAVQKAEADPKAAASKFVQYLANKSGQQADVVTKVIGALLKTGHLKSQLTVEGSTLKLAQSTVLSFDQIIQAQHALLESRGSVKLWVRNLLEANPKLVNALSKKAPKKKAGTAPQKKCPTCGTMNPDTAKACVKDGTDISKVKPVARGGDVPKKSDEPVAGGGKHDKVINAISGQLQGIDTGVIGKILDVIPDFLMAEMRLRVK